jgi:uncharacterized metal-binding protein YceD (DUF177 family)
MAAPFVQGQLREKHLSVTIVTECAHCAQPMQIELDSEMRYRVNAEDAHPLVFQPLIDWQTFAEPNIINAY